ncbi:hypothetical protein ABGB18_19185 [Nonomuraea sp. B12E4]|uniref:hypothetical protein n=1 Tax=Nonomuraea sp. B12E4 TaxID=3153564 RepID=UPI00325F4B1C
METADAVMPFVTAAIGAYGGAVLTRTAELAARTPDARGARILQRVFGRGDPYSRRVIEEVAVAKPDDEPSRTALKLAIMKAFEADPVLATEVAAMLPRPAATAADHRREPAGGGMH